MLKIFVCAFGARARVFSRICNVILLGWLILAKNGIGIPRQLFAYPIEQILAMPLLWIQKKPIYIEEN